MADEDLSKMFDDFATLSVAPPAVAPVVAPASAARLGNKAPRAEVQMMTLRGASGAMSLDDLIEAEERKNSAATWKAAFAVGEEVEALWEEDKRWYAARIDSVDVAERRYGLTFTEYGNSQSTAPDCVRASLARRFEQSSQRAAETAKPPRRVSEGHIRADLFPAAPAPATRASGEAGSGTGRGSQAMSSAFDSLVSPRQPEAASSSSRGNTLAAKRRSSAAAAAADMSNVIVGGGGNSGAAMSSAFDNLIGGEVDYSAMAQLPPLPAKAPDPGKTVEYKNYMRLKYEHQMRSEAPRSSGTGTRAPGATGVKASRFSFGKKK